MILSDPSPPPPPSLLYFFPSSSQPSFFAKNCNTLPPNMSWPRALSLARPKMRLLSAYWAYKGLLFPLYTTYPFCLSFFLSLSLHTWAKCFLFSWYVLWCGRSRCRCCCSCILICCCCSRLSLYIIHNFCLFGLVAHVPHTYGKRILFIEIDLWME